MTKKQGKGTFAPVKTSRIPDKVYKQIVSMISNGDLMRGEKLPSEREMAILLNVSRQSVREALYRTESMGLIEIRQGEGSFVVSSARESLKPALAVLLAEHAERVFEFLEIRRLLEGWCAEKAATEATAENLETMQDTLRRMELLKPTEKRWEKADMEFHLSMAAATQNVIAMHIMDVLKDSFRSYFQIRRLSTKAERKGTLLEQHRDLFEEIKRRDPSMAKQRALEHLDYIEQIIGEDMGIIPS